MQHENLENNSDNVSTGDVCSTGISGSGDSVPCNSDDVTDPRIKPGIPVEDIGVDEFQATALGLLKSEADYKASKAAEIAEAEAYDDQTELRVQTKALLSRVLMTLSAVKSLGDVVNKSYGKYMLLGMEEEAAKIRDLNSNIHFNALYEKLEECKARAYLLSVELQSI